MKKSDMLFASSNAELRMDEKEAVYSVGFLKQPLSSERLRNFLLYVSISVGDWP